MLCDGVGCAGYVWKYLRPALTEHYQVVHWHYRGHGDTPMPRDRDHVAICDHADDAIAVMDHAGVERAIFVGHSMGVQVSLESYRRHRARVAGLVLMCGAPGRPLGMTRNPERAEFFLTTAQRIVSKAPGLFNGLLRSLLPTEMAYRIATWLEVDPEEVQKEDFMPYLQAMSRMDAHLFLDTLAAANQHSAVDLLPEIDIPALIIGGSDDGFTSPVLSQLMYDQIADAEMLIVERGSHTAPLEQPELVCNTVLDFLGRRLI